MDGGGLAGDGVHFWWFLLNNVPVPIVSSFCSCSL